jgi:hypothetical protein
MNLKLFSYEALYIIGGGCGQGEVMPRRDTQYSNTRSALPTLRLTPIPPYRI